MNRCPWCGNEARIQNSVFGYFVECNKNGHIHNIGCLVTGNTAFSKTKKEAIKLWNEETEKMKR